MYQNKIEQLFRFPIQDEDFKQKVIECATAFMEKDQISVSTSGSTGQPKNIVIQKWQIENSARATGEYFSINKKSHLLCCLSPDYIAGKMMIYRALVLEATITCIPPHQNIFTSFEPQPIDFVAMVPSQMKFLVKHNPKSLENFSTILLGGAPVHEDLEEKIQQHHNNVYHSYGMTETVSHCAIRKLGQSNYEALKNVKFDINPKGELQVFAPQISGMAMVQTHDIVQMVSPTSFRWMGRSDFVINSGGHKIFPEILESRIKHLFKGDIMVSSQKDETFGEKVIVLSTAKESEDIVEKMKAILHPYEVPRTILAVKTLFLTRNNKLDRNKNKAVYTENAQ